MSTAAVPAPWRRWLAACRPQTLPVGAAPVLMASALAATWGRLNVTVLVAALLGAACLQIGCNLFNDWADGQRGADTPERLGPVRATQSGLLPARHVLWASLVSFGLATACGGLLLQVGGALVVTVGLCSLAAAMLYTGGPYPLAYHGWGDLFAFAFFGPVAVVTTYVLHAGTAPWWVVCWGVALGAFSAAVLVVNNLRDRFTDAKVHKRTLAVRWGARVSRWQYLLLVAIPYVLSLWVALAGEGPTGRGAPYVACSLLPWLSLPRAGLCVRQIFVADGAALNPLLGQTARLLALYALLVATGALLQRPGLLSGVAGWTS